ncbi:hypothetical protein Tco_0640671 [Tanacetum coccineum]
MVFTTSPDTFSTITPDTSPSLPLPPPLPVLSPAPPPSPICSLGYRAAMIRLRAEAASTSHSLSLPPPFLLSPTKSDAPSSGTDPSSSAAAARPVGGFRVDYDFVATMDREIRRDPEREVGYGIPDSRSMDASDLARREVMSLRTTVLGQMSEIRELHAADCRRQAVISEMLKADYKRSAEMRELRTTDHT